MKIQEDAWLVKTNSFLIDDLIFMLNTDRLDGKETIKCQFNQSFL